MAVPMIHFTIEGKYLGSTEVKKFLCHNSWEYPASYVVICPVCGEPWARVEVDGQAWHSSLRKCKAHGNGLMNKIFPRNFEENFPSEVLRREIQLLSELGIADRDKYEIKMVF